MVQAKCESSWVHGLPGLSRRRPAAEESETSEGERVVIEVLEDVVPDEAVIKRCRALRADGYEIALDD